MAFNLKEMLVRFILPTIVNLGSEELLKLLQKLHDDNRQQYIQLVTGAYPLIDIQLENLVKTTGTNIDDDIVLKLKRVVEDSASANGVELSNLDED